MSVPPPPDETHEELSVDDQVMVLVALFAIEEGVAVRVTVGTAEVGEPLPPLHDVRPENASSTAIIPLKRILDMCIFSFVIIYLNK